MGRRLDARTKFEFGDFQTPAALASEVCAVLAGLNLTPTSIVEPTCGTGSLLFAALAAFPAFGQAIGSDINADYIAAVRGDPRLRRYAHRVTLCRESFFDAAWQPRLDALASPVLVIGNPPWVTSADLGSVRSRNVPSKTNFQRRAGLDARTGKSNFDISEWMLIKLLQWLDGRDAAVAMLCKSAVARRVLSYAWSAGVRVEAASMYEIDAATHFRAAVDACLLVCMLGERGSAPQCRTFAGLSATRPGGAFGYVDGHLLASIPLYERWKHLAGASPYKWRSGIKHDCAAVMELRAVDDGLVNGHGEAVAIEAERLYPLMKSSDVARGAPAQPRFLVVTQHAVGEDTRSLKRSAPRAWAYLTRYRARFERRGSSIYRGKSPFAIFGVGDYSFAPWKIAISGLYKKLAFRLVGPRDGKPVVLDDTCYFLPCASEVEAQLLWRLLCSEPATQFYSAFIFWDAKRPITTDLLRRLDLRAVAKTLGLEGEFRRVCAPA